MSSLAGRWDAASAAHYANLVLSLLPPRPLFPIPTFLCLSCCWLVLGVLLIAGGALTSPAEWELQGTSGTKAVLGAKREISLFCGLGWGRGGQAPFMPLEKYLKAAVLAAT